MRLYESETEKLLADPGVAIPDQRGKRYVVKAQVLTQNRYEHSGIRFADSIDEAECLATEMRETNVDGYPVEDVLIEQMVEYDAEHYVSFLYDTDVRAPVVIFGTEGGTGVEDRTTLKRLV